MDVEDFYPLGRLEKAGCLDRSHGLQVAPTRTPGQLGQRVAAEVPDGTKVRCRKLVRWERDVQIASPGLVELVAPAPEGGRQVGGEVGYGPRRQRVGCA